jgi:ribosomal protein S18 acetylase RimI-like enzyme
MIEVRPIRMEEAETFLRLLCGVFALDFRRAQSVFFSEPFFDLKRKWALFEDGQMRCTMTTVPLEFGDGPAMGIAGVATLPEHRGRDLARQLIDEAVTESAARGEERSLLFANNERLYAKCGFRVLDRVVTQPLPPGNEGGGRLLSRDEVTPVYDAWASEHPGRLRRDKRRWEYWSWNMKTAFGQPGGYVCYEFGRVRELLPGFSGLPFSDPADWFGLESLARVLGIRLDDPRQEMLLMGRKFDAIPQMFLTDQF